MDIKNKILENLNKLKISYYSQENKKWQIKALTSAITNIEKYENDIISGEDLKKNIKGIGDKISKYIDEIIEHGYLLDLKNIKVEEDSYKEFMNIIGVGNAKAKVWISNGIKNIDQLKKEIKNGNISITNNINLGLKYYEDLKERIPREEIISLYKIIEKILKEINKDLIYEICGSFRRNESNSGDIDFLITHKNYNSDINNFKDYNFLKKILNNLKEKNYSR